MLIMHRASSGVALTEGLAGTLAAPIADPSAYEAVAAQAKGVKRGLARRLALCGRS